MDTEHPGKGKPTEEKPTEEPLKWIKWTVTPPFYRKDNDTHFSAKKVKRRLVWPDEDTEHPGEGKPTEEKPITWGWCGTCESERRNPKQNLKQL